MSNVEAVLGKLNASGKASRVLKSRGTEMDDDKVISLDLSGLDISEIPSGAFEGLSDLKRLYLNYNKLSKIDPKSFAGLSGLTFLSLFANEISELPEDFFNAFPDLEWLDLRENGLKKVPSSVIGLKKLNYLYLQNNPDLTTDDYDFSEDYHSKRDVGKFVEAYQKAMGVTPKAPAKKATKKTTAVTEESKEEQSEEVSD